MHHKFIFFWKFLFKKWGKNLEETKKQISKTKTCYVESKKKHKKRQMKLKWHYHNFIDTHNEGKICKRLKKIES
jgi:hypothetical protein